MVKFMQEVTIKREENIVLKEDVNLFLNPKFVFLPIEAGYKVKVGDHDYVYKNDILAQNADGKTVYAPTSGKVLGIKKMNYFKRGTHNSLVIENDFKENVRVKKSAKKHINAHTKEEFVKILQKSSYEYRDLDLIEWCKKGTENIIVNAVDLDPNFCNKHRTWRENEENILETCDFLGEIMGAKKIYFVLLNTDSETIEKLTNLIGTYPNIELKLVSNAYPNGMGALQRKLLKLEDALVLELESVLDVFQILKRELPITSRLITITGPAVTPNAVIRVKLGTLLSEVFVHNFDFTSPKVDVYVNGFLYGEKVDNLKYVIDSNIDGIYIKEREECEEESCLNCGQCSRVCPEGLNPKYVFDHDGKVDTTYYDKCLQCGLCNYVCPANRNLKQRMKGRDEP